MKRSLMLALILSLAHASIAFAGRGPRDAGLASRGGNETLLQSGQRLTRQAAKARPSPTVARAEQSSTSIATSGMRKRTKILLAVGIGVAFGGVAYAIDQGVEDSTPSSLGQR
jgi:hypothetical protein